MDWSVPSSAAELADWLSGKSRPWAPYPPGAPLVVTGAPEDETEDELRDVIRHRGVRVVSTASLSEVLAYEPCDLVITVGAGLRASRLRAILAEEGQWLPAASHATVTAGGLVASGQLTAFDLAYGALRRHVLACTLVTHDGRLLRWGRPVMKNVAGYDLHGLCCGSHGRLGILAELSFRLWPRPPEERAVDLQGPDSLELGDALVRNPANGVLAGDSVTWTWEAGERPGGELRLLLTGSPESVEVRDRRWKRWVAERGGDAVPCPESAHAMGEARTRSLNESALRFSVRPVAWATLTGRVREALSGQEARLEGYPFLGVLRCAYRRPADPVEASRLLQDLFQAGQECRIAVERGGESDLALALGRRTPEVRKLEEGVIAALGGRPREWIADYL